MQFILLIFGLLNSFAAEPNILSYDVHTKESIIETNGIKYRKVEYKGDVFYMRLLEVESTAGDLQLSCGSNEKLNMENQVLISTQITKRSSLFIEGLKQTCKQISGGNQKVDIDPNIQVGFIMDDSKKVLLKNRKVYWNPLKGLVGVGAEW